MKDQNILLLNHCCIWFCQHPFISKLIRIVILAIYVSRPPPPKLPLSQVPGVCLHAHSSGLATSQCYQYTRNSWYRRERRWLRSVETRTHVLTTNVRTTFRYGHCRNITIKMEREFNSHYSAKCPNKSSGIVNPYIVTVTFYVNCQSKQKTLTVVPVDSSNQPTINAYYFMLLMGPTCIVGYSVTCY